MGRYELREKLFQLLFRVEFYDSADIPEQEDLFFTDNQEEQPIDEESRKEIQEKFQKILEKLSELDQMINEKTERWNTKRFGKVELAVMRLALYEMLFDDDIHEYVALDEAVRIAKKYGQDSSGAFVNGVLVKFLKNRKN